MSKLHSPHFFEEHVDRLKWLLVFACGAIMGIGAGILLASKPCYEARNAAAFYQSEAMRLAHEKTTLEPFALVGIGIRSDELRGVADRLLASQGRGRVPKAKLVGID